MDQSVFQRNSQLHQPKRGRSHHGQVSPATDATFGPTLPVSNGAVCLCLQSAWHSLCVRHHWGGGHRPRAERTNKGIHSSNLLPKCSSLSHTGVCTCSNGLFVREGRCVLTGSCSPVSILSTGIFGVALLQIQHLPDQLRRPLQPRLIYFSLPLLCLL